MAQDTALSRREQGFETPRERQFFRGTLPDLDLDPAVSGPSLIYTENAMLHQALILAAWGIGPDTITEAVNVRECWRQARRLHILLGQILLGKALGSPSKGTTVIATWAMNEAVIAAL